MPRTATKETSLAALCPALMLEWDSEENTRRGLDPERLLPGSNKRARWLCSRCGYSWDVGISKRAISHHGCHVCTGQAVSEETCLAAKNPTLAGEWCQERNGDLTPTNVASWSGKKVWWNCVASLGHPPFRSSIDNRHNGTGCPECGKLKKGGRPQTKSLQSACADCNLSSRLSAAWNVQANLARNLDPSKIGFQTHAMADWFCPDCGSSYRRQISNWFNRQPAACDKCIRASAWETRRKESISVIAERERECRIMLAQWDELANADSEISPTTISPTYSRRIAWRCGGCGFVWEVSPKHRWASLRQKLTKIAERKEVDEPDSEFGCPRCCAFPSSSSVELSLFLELRKFFADAVSGFLDGFKDNEIGGLHYAPDIVLPSVRLFLEYDGYRYHKAKASEDEARSAKIEKCLPGWQILRVRETGPGGTPLPPIKTWTVDIPYDTTVVRRTGAVLRTLQERGVFPKVLKATLIEDYESQGIWLSENEALEQRRLLSKKCVGPAGLIKRIGEKGLLDLFEQSGCSWTEVARRIGFGCLSSLTSSVKRYYGCSPTRLALKNNRPTHKPTTRKGLLKKGKFDHLLGKVSDAEVARLSGTTTQAVWEYRKRRGISAATPGKKHEGTSDVSESDRGKE